MEKVVIVTGAAGVRGSAIAQAFGNAGNNVLVSDINAEPLSKLVSLINGGPGQALPYLADIRNYNEESIYLWDGALVNDRICLTIKRITQPLFGVSL